MTNVTTMSAHDVRAAIETIETSYSYESDRWMPSYQALCTLEHEMRAQLKPYAWISALFLLLGVVTFLALIGLLSSNFYRLVGDLVFVDYSLFNVALYLGFTIAPGAIIWLGPWLTLRVAARQHPLLVFKPRVEAAISRYQPPPSTSGINLESNK